MSLKNDISAFYGLKALYFWSFTSDEGEDNELILNPNCICIEVEGHILEISDIEGKLKIEAKNSIDSFSKIDTAYKIDIRTLILDYPEASHYIRKIGGINVEIREEIAICEAIEIWLYTENYGTQVLFIHSGLYGLRLRESKHRWQKNWYTPAYGDQLKELWFI